MSNVWISRESWDLVWNALHNIRINMNFTIKEPYAALTGDGTGARLCLDLPQGGNGETAADYEGMFKCMEDTELINGIEVSGIRVKNGICTVIGKSFYVPDTFIQWNPSYAFKYILLKFYPSGWETEEGTVYVRAISSDSIQDYSIVIGYIDYEYDRETAKYNIIQVFQQRTSDFSIAYNDTSYKGDFAVTATSSGIEVRAGFTDIGNIETTSFSAAEANGKSVYLIGCANGREPSDKYPVLYVGETQPSALYKSYPVRIAYINQSGIPRQDWTSGPFYFGEIYLL